MKETPVSSCEKSFLLEGLWEGKRLDGRGWLEGRQLEVVLGRDWGSCQVLLGRTRVLAQVSATVTEPRLARPNEGILIVNVELSPIAAPKFEVGRLTEEGVEINRTIERCLKESRCLDLESLCIISEEKVWTIRLDLHILNHCGNLADACSVAGLTALSHFRRLDVTLKGDMVTVHPASERDPLPLAVHHNPVTSTFALFQLPGNTETLAVCDPSLLEEQCMAGKMVIGVNAYREICTLHLAGQIIVDKKLVMRLTKTAAERSKKVVDIVKEVLARDEELRKKGQAGSFASAIQNPVSIMHSTAGKTLFDFSKVSKGAMAVIRTTAKSEEVPCKVKSLNENVVEVIPETMEIENDSDVSSSEDDVMVTGEKTKEEVLNDRITDRITLDEDSEEEETLTLTSV